MSNETETVTTVEEPVETTTQEVTKTDETTSEVEQVSSNTETLPRNVSRDEDGQLVMKRGTSVYKGKDLDELLDNVAKGIEEKDNYVLQLRTDKTIKSDKPKVDDEEPVSFPEPDSIRENIFNEFNKRYGKVLPTELKPDMAHWDVKQWREFADANEIRADELADLKTVVRTAKDKSDKAIEKADTEYINDTTRKQASRNVKELLTELKLNPDDYSKAYNDAINLMESDANQKQGGIYKSGRIELAVAKAVIKDLIDKGVKGREQEVLKRVAEGQKAKDSIRGGSVSGAQKTKETKVPETLKEIKEQLRKEGAL